MAPPQEVEFQTAGITVMAPKTTSQAPWVIILVSAVATHSKYDIVPTTVGTRERVIIIPQAVNTHPPALMPSISVPPHNPTIRLVSPDNEVY